MRFPGWLLLLLMLSPAGPARADALDGVRAAREAALLAEAPRLATERWVRAEKDLAAATRRLERGDAGYAEKRSAELTAAYRDAELQALRSRYLSPVLALLIAADDARAERYAPRTLESARQKLALAEAELDANRASPGKAAASIEAARLEAERAGRIAGLVRQVGARERDGEDAILALEDVFARIATAANVTPVTIVGNGPAAEELVAAVEALRSRADTAERDLAGRDRQIASLEQELRDMDARLGGASAERDQLIMTLEAQKRERERVAILESLFTEEEGTVVQQGRDVVLRLTGLPFRPGSADLNSRALVMLDKVQRAIGLYPRSTIVVEGHTDSSGSAAANQRLSEERARTVAQRLASALALPAGRIEARGYGESRPVASNDSAEGRAANRRIDVLIQTTAD